MLIFWSLVRNSVVLAVYLLFSVACFLTVHEHQYKGYMYSYAISAVIGYAAAYVMNRKLTFQADANPVLSTILYTIMVVCTIAFNTWFGAYLGTIVTNHHWDSVFITLLTKLLVMTVPTLWTYPLNRFVIHRKKKAKVEPLPESADTPAGAAA